MHMRAHSLTHNRLISPRRLISSQVTALTLAEKKDARLERVSQMCVARDQIIQQLIYNHHTIHISDINE
jgi:hypothetical protein